jgi:hypothetical protein
MNANHLDFSRAAVALIGKPQTCPTCNGNKRLGSFWCGILAHSYYDCPTCNGTGKVTTPCPVEDYNGGWDCCPICFDGMNNGIEPCPNCQEVLANEDVGKNVLALATQAAKAMGDYRKVQRAIYGREAK